MSSSATPIVQSLQDFAEFFFCDCCDQKCLLLQWLFSKIAMQFAKLLQICTFFIVLFPLNA